MKWCLSFLAFLAVLMAGKAAAQPGPPPNPWVVNGSQISFGGCALMPITIAGGCRGNGSFAANQIFTGASTTAGAGLTITPGVAPSAPADGQVWVTITGMYAQVNGSTVGPLGTGGGGGSGCVPSGTIGQALVYAGGGACAAITNAQLTALINPATTSLSGALPAFPGGTTTFFRGDGTYQTIPWISSLTGDATATGPGASTLTLATVNAGPGTVGSSTAIPVITVNAKGLLTSSTTAAVVAPAGTLTGDTLAANVLNSSLTSTGTLTGGATGSGFTVALSSSTITGTLADARLSANVPLINASNTFTGSTQTFPNVVLGAASSATGTLKYYNSGNGNSITFQAGATGADLSYTWPTAYGSAGCVWSDPGGNGTLSCIAAPSGNVPTGGTTGQALVKNSNTNFDTTWATLSGTGTVTSIATNNGITGGTITTTGTIGLATITGPAVLGISGAGPTVPTALTTLPAGVMPALTGDATTSAGSVATTVAKINGATLGTTTATSGNLLVANGTQWVSVASSGDVTIASSGAMTIGANKVTMGDIAQIAGLSLIGRSASSSGNVAAITGTANQFLGVDSGGTALAFATMSGDATLATGVITLGSNVVSNAKFRTSAALSVVGRSASSSGNVADISGTANQFLGINSGGTTLAFQTLSGDATLSGGAITIGSNAVTAAKIAQFTGLSVVGVTGAATANVAAITGTADQVLRVNSAGTALAFGQVNLASSNAVTGILLAANVPAPSVTVFTSAGAATVANSPRRQTLVIRKASPAATTVNLPASPATDQIVTIKDGACNASANNITVTPSSGNIDNASTFVLTENCQSVTVQFDGTQWDVL